VLAALAGLFAERSGVVDIGLEGKMLGAAFAAATVAAVTGSAWLGLLAGMFISICLALLHGLASITYNGNQVVSGMALNILVAGLAPVLGNAWFGKGGQTPLLTSGGRFTPIVLPGAEALRGIPVLGPIYAEIVSGHNIRSPPPRRSRGRLAVYRPASACACAHRRTRAGSTPPDRRSDALAALLVTGLFASRGTICDRDNASFCAT
jgi:hypothetical protein